MSKAIHIRVPIHLDDVLQSKENGFFKLSSSALKVGVDGLSPRRVLEVVSHLHKWIDTSSLQKVYRVLPTLVGSGRV